MTARLNEGNVAFVVTVAAAFASSIAFSSAPPGGERLAALLLGGLAYVGLGVGQEAFVRRVGPAWRAWGAGAYFLGQTALGIALIVLGRGEGFLTLLLFPLVGQAVASLPTRGAVAVSVAIWMTYVAVISRVADVPTALRAGMAVMAGFLFVAFVTRAGKSERQAREEVERLNAALRGANDRLRAYAAQAEELAAASERARLAREIHDGLGHYLTGINVQIEAARAVLEADREREWGRGMEALATAQRLAKEGLQEVRRSVAAFRSGPVETRPLAEAVQGLAAEGRASGLDVSMEVRGTPREVPAQASLTLYRAAQEGLTNVRKHAGAAGVWVGLDFSSKEWLRLTVEDDGPGLVSANGGGFGLLGMRERAQLLGGRVDVANRSEGGVTLTVEVPG